MPNDDNMTSLKPHILRAVYAWILENNLTPHILVNANSWGVQVPRQYVEQGKIVLNIEPIAVREFDIGNDKVTFKARFHGVSRHVTVPVRAVLAIFAAENGRGQLFTDNEFEADDMSASPQTLTNTIVVNNAKQQVTPPHAASTDKTAALTIVNPTADKSDDNNGGGDGDGDDNGGGGRPPSKKNQSTDTANAKKTRSWLRVIK